MSLQPTDTMESSPEQGSLPHEKAFFGMIDGVANHEAKALVGTMIATQNDQWFDAARLTHELAARQQGEWGWNPSYMTPFRYCLNTLEPMGAVVKGTTQTHLGIVEAYKATDIGATSGLAVAGAVLGWSLEYPEISVQTLFSGSQSKGSLRAPSTRYAIYKHLIHIDDEGISYGKVNDAVSAELGIDAKVAHVFQEPKNEEIFEVNTNLRSYNPVYRIEEPDYKGNKRLDLLGDATRAVYAAMGNLARDGKIEVTLDELVEASTLAIRGVAKSIIRRRIVDTGKSSAGLPGLTLIDGDGREVSKETQSIVKLQPAVKEAVTDLVARLEAVRNGEKTQDFMAEAAMIINNPNQVAALMSKAQRFSPNHRAQVRSQSTASLVLSVLGRQEGQPGLDLVAIQKELNERGEEYKTASISVVLRRLINQGKIEVVEVNLRDDKGVKKRNYSLRSAT